MEKPSLEDMKTLTNDDLTDAEEEAINARNLAQMMADAGLTEETAPADVAAEEATPGEDAEEETAPDGENAAADTGSGREDA